MKAFLVGLAGAGLLFAGCGGGAGLPSEPTVQGPIVKGPGGVWIFQPAGKPKALVIFFHGQGGPLETTPHYHRALIDHLVGRGDLVLYPRYELDYDKAILGHAVSGVRTALERTTGDDLPVFVIGYSRGGALAVEYAAVAQREHLPVPKLIASIFSTSFGEQSHLVDLSALEPHTRVVLFIGDKDVGGAEGSRGLLARLGNTGFPAARIRLHLVRSHGTFSADHLSFLSSTRPARRAFWTPLDRILAKAES